MKGSCGQGKPYMKIELPVREYKDGGVVYTDKNDPDDKVKMKDLEVMEKKMDTLQTMLLAATGTVIIFLGGIILTLLNG